MFTVMLGSLCDLNEAMTKRIDGADEDGPWGMKVDVVEQYQVGQENTILGHK